MKSMSEAALSPSAAAPRGPGEDGLSVIVGVVALLSLLAIVNHFLPVL